MPIAAPYQILAAVVTLETLLVFVDLSMMPAPKNPTPDTICAAIRVESFDPEACAEIKANVIAAPITIVCVLIPAGFFFNSRSAPIIVPQRSERKRLNK